MLSLLIPIRTLTSLGLSNSWDANSRTVTIKNTSGDVLTITPESNIAYKNGKRIEMSVPAQSKHGRVLVPIRFVSESMGYQMHYETIRNIIFVISSEHTLNTDVLDPSDLVSARKAAISLPIVADFKTIGFATRRDVTYRFPEGKADMYELMMALRILL
ncbi:copper amine oxidase N-terminal domain-containing protein [Paenibacillus antibioticophila]|uniref:copper amine oxidase N-terminal domain-containing protein n=1 Tax=Paenibacillus antibioticophila TaxID=1274374 RepID=UPI001CA35D97|nr:copper amine oxidase N-terminal domain-containing protein [Paenibacillus antibioticophila]